jgi:hypothetical protein
MVKRAGAVIEHGDVTHPDLTSAIEIGQVAFREGTPGISIRFFESERGEIALFHEKLAILSLLQGASG